MIDLITQPQALRFHNTFLLLALESSTCQAALLVDKRIRVKKVSTVVKLQGLSEDTNQGKIHGAAEIPDGYRSCAVMWRGAVGRARHSQGGAVVQ